VGLEIDVIVFFRGRLGGRATNGLHWGGYGENHKIKNYRELFDDAGEWHTFGLLWTDSGYTFYRDGKETWQTTESISHVPEYLILSTIVGQRSTALKRASLPDRFMVDYVRVYADSASASSAGENP
jgi:beta-glucanase (GH16 family)